MKVFRAVLNREHACGIITVSGKLRSNGGIIMTGILDPAYYWLPLGVLTIAFAGWNLIRALLGKKKGWELLLFLSLVCGMLEILVQYFMVHKWVQLSDWSALMDVVPGMSAILILFIVVCAALNGVVLIRNRDRRK